MTAASPEALKQLKAAFGSLTELWQLSDAEKNRIAGVADHPILEQEKQALCLQIHTSLSAIVPAHDVQAAWLRNATTPDSPLGGAAPIELMVQGVSGLTRVRDYVAHRADR